MGNNWKGPNRWSGLAKQRSCPFENSKTRRTRRRRVIVEAGKVVAAVKRGDPNYAGFVELVAELERFGSIRPLSKGRYRISTHGSEKICQILVATKRLEEC